MIKKRQIFFVVLISLFLFKVFNFTYVFAQTNSGAVDRLTGNNVYEASINISKAGWTNATTVIIASNTDYSGAMLATTLSKLKDAPILLTGKLKLDSILINEIKRLKATKAYIIGGAGVISTQAEKQLKVMKIEATRISGIDRYESSKNSAEIIGIKNGIIVAGNLDYSDILSIAPIAGIKGIPILISQKNALDKGSLALIKGETMPLSYIIGGTGVLSPLISKSVPNNKRLSGIDRYASNLGIINQFAGVLNFDTIYLASGKDFKYSLSGGALAAKSNAPIFLTDKDSISKATIDFIKNKKVNHVIILGGVDSVSEGVKEIVNKAIESLIVVEPTSVAFNKNTSTLEVGKTDSLSATVSPANTSNKAVAFTSSDNTIATVDTTGKVSAVSTGAAIILATTVEGMYTASCTITVVNPVIKASAISLNKSIDELEVGGVDILNAAVAPEDATNKDITWTSSNNETATVDNAGTVSAVNIGETIITATSSDGGFTTSCGIIVINPENAVPVTSVGLDKTYDYLQVGWKGVLSTSIAPDNATDKYSSWSSSDPNIVAVDNLGNIKAVSEGEALITVTTLDGNFTATCDVTIIPAQPVITEPTAPSVPTVNKKLVFAIDIGHNCKFDVGAVGIRTEDKCTKAVGIKVIAKLRALGYKVIDCSPTNPTSTTNALKQRVDKANAGHANFYMAIHFNKFNGSASGSEVFYGSSKIKTKAQQVLKNLAALGYINRGVLDNSRGLYVLKNTNMPAMLVECAFVDSAKDMARYDPDAIANALVKGLLSNN